MTRIRYTIGQKLGALHVGVVIALAAVTALVALQLRGVETDVNRLLEENRELAVTNELTAAVDELDFALARPDAVERGAPGAVEVQRHLQRLATIVAQLRSAQPDDPSREEHSDAEARIADSIAADLEACADLLATGAAPAALIARLAHLRRYAETLDGERRREAARAAADVRARNDTTARVAVATMLVVAVALCGAWLFVRRTVVVPIRELHERAERLGRGDPDVRPHRRRHDEIGQLAEAFADMADRIAHTHGRLREKVQTRTRDFVRAARVADLGVLAAGVAHEINNPLGSITSCAEGLLRRLARGSIDPDDQREYLQTIADEAYRARTITGRLLELARPAPPAREPIDVRRLLAEVERLAPRQLADVELTLRTRVVEPLPALRADRGELLQALLNLVRNAADASVAAGPGPHPIDVTAARAADGGVELAVADRGVGVPPADAERVFEPFFTTKPPGRGTGLGLALIAAIAETHGGSVRLDPAWSPGARFVLWLPPADGDGAAP
ncbi:MAG: HAMP domain-containing histidine kinase [Planctomycetes bacterium]|nr:HAMP domain-containing histidine kinase [Planctomycetota bacterium]